MRACGEPLTRSETAFVCPRAHTFDVAKSGYVNLMQLAQPFAAAG